MIRQIFKLIWNRKRRNFLLAVEIFFSFMVLFAVGSMSITGLIRYLRPLGFETENTWMLTPNRRGGPEQTDAEQLTAMQHILQEVTAYPEVRHASWATGCLPYQGSRWCTHMYLGEQGYDMDIVMVDDGFAAAVGLPLIEGRWFGPEDNASARPPIVISSQVKEDVFGDAPAVGAILHDSNDETKRKEYVIVGVTGNYRYQGEFREHLGTFFKRNRVVDTVAEVPDHLVLAMQSGTGIEFEERLSKRLADLAPGWNFRITTLADQQRGHVREEFMSLVVYGTVAAFLVFNVALGLFGVLWYSISRRRNEIGLRRAVGAHRRKISGQIMGEAAVLATFAIIVGVFVAAQVPILGLEESVGGPIYILAMALAALLIYLIVSLCALYPSRLAARIQPAEALHDE